jgi:DNA-binding LacI/PurR family transcriptional regulator
MPKTLHSTKHFHLVRQLRPLIAKLAPGEAIPTQQQLKDDFNVSQNTIELALARLRREGLVERPAGKQRLVKAEICDPADHYIAIIRPDWPSLGTENICQAIVEAGHAMNWSFDIVNYRSQVGLDMDRAMGDNDGAILLLTGETMPDHLRDALTYRRKPIVLAQDMAQGLDIDAVVTDDGMSMQLAVEHLASLGHREIALLLPDCYTFPMHQAVAGWRRAMQQLGISADELDRLLVIADTKPFQKALNVAYPHFKRWLAENWQKTTAVIASNMEMGFVAYRCVHEMKLDIPGQFSIVKSDNITHMGEFFYPPATTLEMNMHDYGQNVVDLLQMQFANEPTNIQTVLIPSRIVARDSTGPVPQRIAVAATQACNANS